MSTHNGNDDAQREATRAWDNHLRGRIHDEHEAMMEIVAGAIAQLQREAKIEVGNAMREAALQAIPRESAERERIAKAIVDATDRLREDIRAEMRTNLRVAILEQAGLVPHVKGTWDEAGTYSALDICMRDGTAWIAKYGDPGPLPGEGWQILSCKGERGKPGAPGARGEPGPQGEMGPTGATLTIAKWEIRRKHFAAIPIMSDGSLGPPLFLRELFEQFQEETS